MKMNNNFFLKPVICEKGVTLVELMIAVAISGFVVASIYMTYKAQQRAATVQEQVAEMQQTIRASLSVMEKDMRMAGYDADGKIDDSVDNATNTKFTFRYWDDANDEPDLISYRFDNSTKTLDRWLDHNDNDTSTKYYTVADNIDNVEFFYTMADSSQTLTPGSLNDIRSIQISILARSRNNDPDYTNTNTYTTASGATIDPSPDDGHRRRQLTATVECRNLGL